LETGRIAGLLPNNSGNMINWLQSPQKTKPGDAMPDLGLSKRDAADIAAYLATVRY
jgi:cytochrome c2